MEKILVNGYAYPTIGDDVLNKWLLDLSMISAFSYGITEEGELIELDDSMIIEEARKEKVGMLMVITSLGLDGQFSDELVAMLLENPWAMDRLVNSILATVKEKNLFGVDFDFEFVRKKNRDTYTELVEKTTLLLNENGYIVTVALAPKISDEQVGLLYEGHDYKGMGEAANFTLIMTYEWGYTYGPPMAVAPINKVREVVEYGTSRISPDKILMGIPNYGYDWKLPYVKGESKAEKINNEEAVARAEKYGVKIMFDEVAKSPYYRYIKESEETNEDGDTLYEEHEVWFENLQSYQAKMDLVDEYGLAGISIWNVMQHCPSLEKAINENFEVAKVFE